MENMGVGEVAKLQVCDVGSAKIEIATSKHPKKISVHKSNKISFSVL